MFGWGGDPHVGPFHIASYIVIFAGFVLLAKSWGILYEAQRRGEMAVSGPYAHVRHPQYAGFIAIMAGFLLQWPTLLTLAMFPVLVYMYLRLARREEREAVFLFGDEYRRYMASVPAFVPRLRRGRLGAR
jgi:protein-S-isoprenylcysteine O-methyltransferase Ste14